MAEFLSKINVNDDDYKKTAAKFRKELLSMPVRRMQNTLQYFTPRYGIRYSETVGELSGNIELGPYSEDRVDKSGVNITPRTLYTFFGNVTKEFSPNSVYSTLFGSDVVMGEQLKSTDITLRVMAFLAAKMGASLESNLFKAVRNDAGTKTADLFNGFDTIAKTELDAGKITEALGNKVVIEAITKTNAVDVLKKVCAAADEQLTDVPCYLYVPKHVYMDYCEDYKATTGAVPYNNEFKQTTVEGYDNVTILPLSCKKDSAFLQLTPKQNMLVGMNMMGDEERLSVEKHHAWVLQFVAALFFGTQYESLSKERILFATIDGQTQI